MLSLLRGSPIRFRFRMLPVYRGKRTQRHSWREGVLRRQPSEPQRSSCFLLRWAGLVSCSELAGLLPAIRGPSHRPQPWFPCTCCLPSTQLPLSEWILSAFCWALHWSAGVGIPVGSTHAVSGVLVASSSWSLFTSCLLVVGGACSGELPGRFCQNHRSELGQKTLHGRQGLNSSYRVLLAPRTWLPWWFRC